MPKSRAIFTSMFHLVQSSHSPSTVIIIITTSIVCILVFTMAGQANSMALQAFCSLCIFDLLFIGTSLLSTWIIENNNAKVHQKLQNSIDIDNNSMDSATSLFIPRQTIATFSYGTARFEVLAVFTSTMLSILGAFFILKESIEKYLEDETIHSEYLTLASFLTFTIHMIVIYFVRNQAFDHVIAASSSSWLQEHVSDMFQSACHYVPGLSRLLLPRINPLALLCFCDVTIVFSDAFLLKMGYGNFVDTLSSLLMAFMTFGTMVPMATYSGKILLQTTPAPVIGQLDKCLHEASRLDGVLEFRHEHFWALSFRTLVGSLHVRCRLVMILFRSNSKNYFHQREYSTRMSNFIRPHFVSFQREIIWNN